LSGDVDTTNEALLRSRHKPLGIDDACAAQVVEHLQTTHAR
jgi:hypothetical protein